MKKLILGLGLLISLTFARPRVASADEMHISDVFMQQVELINQMNEAFPKVDVQIFRETCGEENSYYWSRELAEKKGWLKPRIVLCAEMDEHPEAALMFAAHEMGHAITDFYTDTLDEQNADEIGALAMLAYGHHDELMASVQYYLDQEIQGHWPGDPHPSNGYRAWFLRCMALGVEDHGPQLCQDLVRSTAAKWQRRLNDPIETVDFSVDEILSVLRDPFEQVP